MPASGGARRCFVDAQTLAKFVPRKRDYAAMIIQCISTTLSVRDGPLNATSRVPRSTILPT
jgi:hypothetical protein